MPVKGFDRIEDQSVKAIEKLYGKWNEKYKKFVIQNLSKIPYLCDESGIETEFSWMTIRTNIDREFYAKKIDRTCRQIVVQKVLSDYYKNDSLPKSLKKNNISRSCFEKTLSIIGAKVWKPNLKTSNDLRANLYNDYSNGMSGTKVVAKYKTSHKTVEEIVNFYGGNYKKMNSHVENIKHNSFSEIKCEESAYFLGILLADGCVSKNNICLCLQEEDKYLVDAFKKYVVKDFELGPPVDIITPKNPKHKNFARISVCSANFTKNLEKYGMHPRKDFTAEIKLDKIDKSLWHHILRGIFDGDGCISFRSDNLKRAILQITTASKLMKDCLLKILNEIDITPSVHYSKRSNGAYYVQIKSHEDIIKFFEYIYKDSSIFMKRKFLKFAEELNMRNNYILNKTKDQENGNFLGIDWLKTKKKYRVTFNSKRAGPLFEDKTEAALFLNEYKMEHSRYKAPQDLNWINYDELRQLINPARIIRDLNVTLDNELKNKLREDYNIHLD